MVFQRGFEGFSWVLYGCFKGVSKGVFEQKEGLLIRINMFRVFLLKYKYFLSKKLFSAFFVKPYINFVSL